MASFKQGQSAQLVTLVTLLTALSPFNAAAISIPRVGKLPSLDGWPIVGPSVSANATSLEKLIRMPRCDRQYMPWEHPANAEHFCPASFRLVVARNDSAIPRRRIEASCACRSQRGGGGFGDAASCAAVRMPVTELRVKKSTGRAAASRLLLLVETLELRPVGCAAIIPPPRRRSSSSRSTSLSAAELRQAGREVGRQIFRPVSCPPAYASAAWLPPPEYTLRQDSELRPRIIPVARCRCNGQAPVALPIPVLRVLGPNPASSDPGKLLLRDEWEAAGVSCAALPTESP